MEAGSEKDAVQHPRQTTEAQGVLFAQTPNANVVIGVVTDSEPSSLSLLAAGVAGMAARRARRERAKQINSPGMTI
jgi:hypothetical protein